MVDTDFEVDMAVKEKTALRFTREVLEPVEYGFQVVDPIGRLKFETFSEGSSNLPGYTPEQEKEFNQRYLEYLRELDEVRNKS